VSAEWRLLWCLLWRLATGQRFAVLEQTPAAHG
jgi:hypothetical protein